ncbi:hypothetical protein GQ53DRAFT_746802 [Thozetella sp. PMI_491]|nr:hypothetical protein GQ53DRAFT_746802 [Thozetella sp. PMI_491]
MQGQTLPGVPARPIAVTSAAPKRAGCRVGAGDATIHGLQPHTPRSGSCGGAKLPSLQTTTVHRC